MDYKKEYKEMVQRARELHEGGNALTKLQMEIVCPELAENDDEKIRKEILEKQEQEEKKKMRALASTCRNCKFSQLRDRYDSTLCCMKKIVNKYYKKVVRPTESCEMFERKED